MLTKALLEEVAPTVDPELRLLRLDFGRWYDIVRDGRFILARHIATSETIRTIDAEIMRGQIRLHREKLRAQS